jgi:hypothetical protein
MMTTWMVGPPPTRTLYDTCTREGSHVEQGPILDRVVCCLPTLFCLCNDVSFY